MAVQSSKFNVSKIPEVKIHLLPGLLKDSFAAGEYRCDIGFFSGIKYNRHCLCEARLVLVTGGFFLFDTAD